MIFKRKTDTKTESKEYLKKAGKCSPKGLKKLLKQIEAEIKRTEDADHDLLIAKTIITSRLASMRDSGKIPL